jgi:4-hydroxybenzoate polyprenyltransferase
MMVVIPTALMPIGAFFAYTDQLTIEAVILALVNFFYEPGFTWSGTCRDVNSDRKLGFKTLPITYGIQNVAKFITICWVCMLGFSIALFLFTDLGIIYLMGSTISGILLIIHGSNLINHPKPQVGGQTFFKAAKWFWYFSFSIIIDIIVVLAGIVLPNINLLT